MLKTPGPALPTPRASAHPAFPTPTPYDRGGLAHSRSLSNARRACRAAYVEDRTVFLLLTAGYIVERGCSFVWSFVVLFLSCVCVCDLAGRRLRRP